MMSDAVASSPFATTPAIGAPTETPAFRIFQPRNLCSWLFLWYLMLGAVSTFRWFRPNIDAVSTTALLAFVLFGLYSLPWIWFLHRRDRWTPIPSRLLLFGALWGGLTATFFIAMTANGALLSIYNKAISAPFAQDWGPGLAAPFSEETGKGIGILLLLFIAPRIIRTPFDGFILGSFVGLGFQIVEDILYAINQAVEGFGADQAHAAIYIFTVRGVAGFFSHALFSAIWGTGIVYFIGTSVTPRNRTRGIALILTAMLAHGVWDAAAAIGGILGVPAILAMAVLGLIELIVIVMIGRRTSEGERTQVRSLLASEVVEGTITDAELSAVSGSRKDRKRYLKSVQDRGQRHAKKITLDAAQDLAQALAKSGGQNTLHVQFARSEV
ncbi:MAG: PrsW family intramembrane metalloprotease, partial [Thermomicrobiales bacterium]